MSIIREDILTKNKGRCFMKVKYSNVELVVMKDNGYINATALCKQYNKVYKNWCRLDLAKGLIKEASLSSKIPVNKLTTLVTGGSYEVIRGTYIHPILLISLLTWITPQFLGNINDILFNDSNVLTTWSAFETSSSNKADRGYISNKTERRKQLRLANELRGFIEVKTPVGNIDILTPNEIIEVKESKNWKHALGQVISYGHYYPHCQKVIYLFGCNEVDDVVFELCKEYDVIVRMC